MKFSAIVFLDVTDVERAHESAIAVSGGSDGIRDLGLLESAVATPRMTVFGDPAYPTLATMAAALAYAIAKNHAFVDGNKRTATVVSLTFLELNGFPLHLGGTGWVEVFEGLADGRVTREELTRLLVAEMGRDVEIEMDE